MLYGDECVNVLFAMRIYEVKEARFRIYANTTFDHISSSLEHFRIWRCRFIRSGLHGGAQPSYCCSSILPFKHVHHWEHLASRDCCLREPRVKAITELDDIYSPIALVQKTESHTFITRRRGHRERALGPALRMAALCVARHANQETCYWSSMQLAAPVRISLSSASFLLAYPFGP